MDAPCADNHTLNPFYERVTARFSPPIIGKVFVSVLLGVAFLGVHHLAVGEKVFKDFSWFLSVLITTVMLCVYYATHTLRILMSEMHGLGVEAAKAWNDELERVLSDRKFLFAGILFAALNCFVGWGFGFPLGTGGAATATILFGYAMAGFICGMAVLGIYASWISLNTLCSKKLSLEFSSPDRCGGTMFIGEALVIFGAVTLVVGVMISVYILETDWHNPDVSFVWLVKRVWIAFPYIMSLAAVIVPAVPINKALREYKLAEEDRLKSQLLDIRRRIDDKKLHSNQIKDLFQLLEFETKNRQEVHRMRTWPYGLGANLKYFALFISNAFVSIKAVHDLLQKPQA